MSTNRNRQWPPIPLGLASVVAQMDDSKHECRVLDLMFSEEPEQDLKSAVSGFSPDVIALSIRNIDNLNCLYPKYFLPESERLIRLCREVSKATIVVGGPAFTVNPKAVFAYLKPDFGIAGEGELAFPALIDRIEKRIDCSDIPGLVWGGLDGIRINPPKFVEDLDSLNIPRRDLFDNRRYTVEESYGNIVIKQGCPFRCLYCNSPHDSGRRWRKKSPEKIVEELRVMREENGIQHANFTDAIFNHPPDYAEKICRAIIGRGLKRGWGARLHPAFAKRSLLELMQEAGCVSVQLGSDSGSKKMLKRLRKDFSKKDLISTAEILEEIGLDYNLGFLIGGPGEERRTVDETIDFARQRKPAHADFTVGIRVMPNTGLYDIAVEEGVVTPDDPLMEPKFYISPPIKDWIKDYLEDICADRENWTVSHN